MPSVSPALLAERAPALHRVLRGLPDSLLAALVEGVEGADVIVPGRLFAGDSGGCIVGVALRTFHPGLRKRRLRKRRERCSVIQLRHSLAKRVAHLRTLEEVFDRSVKLAEARQPKADPGALAHRIAEWIAAEAQSELLRREVESEWLDALAEQAEQDQRAELARGLVELDGELAGLEPELERELAELVHEWSLPA